GRVISIRPVDIVRVTLVRAGNESDALIGVLEHLSDGPPEFIMSLIGQSPHGTDVNDFGFLLEAMSHKIQGHDRAPIERNKALRSTTGAVKIAYDWYVHFGRFIGNGISQFYIHLEIKF